MYIEIIGGGSLGLLYASKMVQLYNQVFGQQTEWKGVRLWTKTDEQAQFIREQGLKQIERDGTMASIASLPVYPFADAHRVLEQLDEKVHCVWLFVKQIHIDAGFLQQLKRLPHHKEAIMVCYQNGVGHMEKLSTVWVNSSLVWAVTTEAARRDSAYQVTYMGRGETWLGRWKCDKMTKSSEKSEKLIIWTKKLLQKAGFEVSLSKKIQDVAYKKLLINAIINPLTAIFQITNGQLLHHKSTRSLMYRLFQEIVTVYRAAHIPIDEEADWKRVITVCEHTAMNVSSMLQDVQAGKKTECDAITGMVIWLGERYQVSTPLHCKLYRLLLVKQLEVD